MNRCVFIFCLLFVLVACHEHCDSKGVLLYENLGCDPVYKTGNECPVSFNCPKYKPNGKCRFLGQEYGNNDRINGTSYCNLGCFCSESKNRSKVGKIQCAIVDCYFGPDPTPECYKKFELRKCCSTGKQCPPFDNIATCQVDGQTIVKEGEPFLPKNTCYNCVCQKGYTGKYEEPFCIRRPCDVEIENGQQIADKCAPIYENNGRHGDALCCPVKFACASDITFIGEVKPDSTIKSDKTCRMEEKKYRLGDSFQLSYKQYNFSNPSNASCTCTLPPLVTCIKQ